MLRSKVKYLMRKKLVSNFLLNGKRRTRNFINSWMLLAWPLVFSVMCFPAPLAGPLPARDLIRMLMCALILAPFLMLQRIKVISDERHRLRAFSCSIRPFRQKFRCWIGLSVALGLCLVAGVSCRINREFIYIVTTYSNSGPYTDTCIVTEVHTYFPRSITRTVEFSKRPD